MKYAQVLLKEVSNSIEIMVSLRNTRFLDYARKGRFARVYFGFEFLSL
jgi:hypothetical protein